MQQLNNLTPIEVLQLEKERLKRECVEKEREIGVNIVYIQDNAVSILFSFLGELIFKKSKNNENEAAQGGKSDALGVFLGLGFADYLNIVKKFLPIGKELLIAFAIKKLKTWFKV